MVAFSVVLAAGSAGAHAQPAEAATAGAGFYLRSDYLTGVGATRGSLRRGRVDLGLRILNRTRHLAFDVGLGIGGGVQRRTLDPRDGVVDFGLSLDVRGYANPGARLQVFGLGGLALGVLGGSEHDPEEALAVEECPSDAMFFADVSGGVGLELRLSPNAALSGTFRVVRRTHLVGDLRFVARGDNPPTNTTDHLLGVSVGISLIGYFDTPPAH